MNDIYVSQMVENSPDLGETWKENMLYTVELPVSKQNTAEVREAKDKELQNLENYRVFEVVDNTGQDFVTARWVVTQKTKQDGQQGGIIFKTSCEPYLGINYFLPLVAWWQCGIGGTAAAWWW